MLIWGASRSQAPGDQSARWTWPQPWRLGPDVSAAPHEAAPYGRPPAPATVSVFRVECCCPRGEGHGQLSRSTCLRLDSSGAPRSLEKLASPLPSGPGLGGAICDPVVERGFGPLEGRLPPTKGLDRQWGEPAGRKD